MKGIELNTERKLCLGDASFPFSIWEEEKCLSNPFNICNVERIQLYLNESQTT